MTHYSQHAPPKVAAYPKAPASPFPPSPFAPPVPASQRPTVPSMPAVMPAMPVFKIIDFGEVSQEKFESILQQVSKAWGRDIAPLLEDKHLTFKEQFKADITNAAYRVGSKQLLTATKNFIVQYARNSCNEEGKIRSLVELLDTEIGTALMAMFIGLSVSQIPQLAESPKMQRILKEFRVNGMATVGNSAVEAVFTSMLPVVVSALQGIEKAQTIEKVETSSSLEEDLFVSSELETAPPLLRQS